MNGVYMISIIKWLQVLLKKVYHALGLEWIPPEMRENKGEIGFAKKRDSHGISDRGNRGNGGGDDNKLLLSNLISKENCLSRQYSIGSKTKRQTHQILN